MTPPKTEPPKTETVVILLDHPIQWRLAADSLAKQEQIIIAWGGTSELDPRKSVALDPPLTYSVRQMSDGKLEVTVTGLSVDES